MTTDRDWPKLLSSVNRFGVTTRHFTPNFDGGHHLPHSPTAYHPVRWYPRQKANELMWAAPSRSGTATCGKPVSNRIIRRSLCCPPLRTPAQMHWGRSEE